MPENDLFGALEFNFPGSRSQPPELVAALIVSPRRIEGLVRNHAPSSPGGQGQCIRFLSGRGRYSIVWPFRRLAARQLRLNR